MKRNYFWVFLIIVVISVLLKTERTSDVKSPVVRKLVNPTQENKKKTPEERAIFNEARLLHEYYRQVNPTTGEISKVEKLQEFEQARNANLLSNEFSARTIQPFFISRGPTNQGGRTRSLVIDRSDPTENTMLAGAVSGGVFRTTDGGASWTKVSSNNEIHNVTTIVQDPRVGFENIWYYGTGEALGNSASLSGTFYFGQGIWKSTDGGISWSQIPSTASGQNEFDSPFDIITRLAVHPLTGELYAAALGRILRFNGTTWFTEIENSPDEFSTDQETDIVFTNEGRAYAAFAGGNANTAGVWTSPGGVGDWAKINEGVFTPNGRVVLTIPPSNQNKLYILFVNGNTSSCAGALQEADLWLYRLEDQGLINFSNVLPIEGGCLPFNDPFSVQGGYDLVIKVKPDDENYVIIGGTNAYRKRNIFDSSTRFERIGGYLNASSYAIYDKATGIEQHPDQHDFVFSPSNTNKLFSATDGGIHVTLNVDATTVGWQSLNNNYQTYQFYHVNIDPLSGSDVVLGGSQDNGTNVGGLGAGLPDLTTQNRIFGGDGTAVALSRFPACRAFFGSQNGPVYRSGCTGSALFQINPSNSQSQFVTYFHLDPDNNNALYYAGLGTLYKTTDALTVTASTWTNMGNTGDAFGHTDWFQTFSTSNGAYDPSSSYLLMGGDAGHIYRLDDPWNSTNISSAIDITPSAATTGFPSVVTGLAVHPTNNDIVLATYANYGIINLFLTTNATSSNPTWTVVERNLTSHSVRSAAIAEFNGTTTYYIGTARGLYSSSDPINEDWVREAPNLIGYALVSSLSYRHEDNRLLIGTHGNGMFEAEFTETLSNEDFVMNNSEFSIYPNPTKSELNISFTNSNVVFTYEIYNTLGQKIKSGNQSDSQISVSELNSGIYFIEINSTEGKSVKRFIKK